VVPERPTTTKSVNAIFCEAQIPARETPFGLFSHTHLSDRLSRHQTHRKPVNRPFKFQECSQHFFGTHDETLSVAMRVHNPDSSSLRIGD